MRKGRCRHEQVVFLMLFHPKFCILFNDIILIVGAIFIAKAGTAAADDGGQGGRLKKVG